MSKYPTVEEIRAQVAAAKIEAMANLKRDWGTTDVGAFVEALRKAIPNSTSPADAALQARRLLGWRASP